MRPHCFILTEACSRRQELAYFTRKISKNRLVCKNAVAVAYYGSCRLLVMGSCHWPMPCAKHVTRDSRRNPEYHVIRKVWTDTNCPTGKSWPNHVKNEQHIGSEKTCGRKKYWKNIMMQRTVNENAACLRTCRICKRCDEPKIERPWYRLYN